MANKKSKAAKRAFLFDEERFKRRVQKALKKVK
eukprot:CAMPEP_0177680672 /NCGR_PEP_ID=MMETSP0447-20121125/30299_1 /TAXON_ID=0 /ORGANISM="Stygamoeba regulata, Strain BSH-02190019" /LENGTH=32 /DNA_ID= /DNA_START= /DNA_END= /DNA_ORIENTATION=